MGMQPSDTDLSYAAGLFDGEGWFTIAACRRSDIRREYSFQVRAGLTLRERDRHVLDWLSSVFGGKVCLSKKETKKHCAYWKWAVYGSQAQEFAAIIAPRLRIKQEQARLATQFQKVKSAHGNRPLSDEQYETRLSMYTEMKCLNRKGPAHP